jgi:PAS domain S-box-containing protein
MNQRNTVWMRYAVGIILPVAALLLRLALLDFLGLHNVYLLFYPAVIVAALYGGFWVGLTAGVLSAGLADYFLLAPVHSFKIGQPTDWVGLVVFLFSCMMISWASDAMRRAQSRAHQAEALRLSEEKFAAAFANNPAAITLTRLDDGLFFDVNDTWVALLGHSRDDAIGHHARTMGIWPNADAVARFVAELKAKGVVRGWEQEFRKKTGEALVAELSAQLINFRGEQFILSTLVDITDRKRKEAQLRQLNRTLKALSDSNQAMMRAQDEHQFLQDVCQVIVQVCGHAMVWIGFAGNDEARSIRPAAFAGFEAGYLETLQVTWADTERGRGPTGIAIRTGKPCMCKNMQTDPAFAPWREEALKHGYAASLALPFFSEGRPLGAVTIYSRHVDPFSEEEVKLLSDLADDLARGVATLRLRAERAQKEEQLRLQLAVLQSAANGLVITGRDGTIQWVNEAFTRLTGYSPPEAIGQNPRVLKSGRHDETFYKDMWATILAGRVWHGEVINRRKDGSLYPEEMTITPVSNARGEITHFVAVKQDISARKDAEAALRQSALELARSNEELQQFAYVASHDLQEPLRAVTGYLALVEERISDQLDDKGRRHMAGAIQGAERMHLLINDLLELSRVGTRAVSFKPADLNAVLGVALDNLNVRVKETGARIVAEPLPTLNVDANQITMLFQNLIGNAIKFRGQAAPEIHVGASARNGEWVFAVCDNGIGIESQYFERIFRIFQRLHTRAEYPGTGIGLAICKKIVERHGGRIWVESQPGQGSTFCFTIPA